MPRGRDERRTHRPVGAGGLAEGWLGLKPSAIAAGGACLLRPVDAWSTGGAPAHQLRSNHTKPGEEDWLEKKRMAAMSRFPFPFPAHSKGAGGNGNWKHH